MVNGGETGAGRPNLKETHVTDKCFCHIMTV